MNEEFVTKAIEGDRYLKAVQLLDQFDDEIRLELERVGSQIVEENPGLFVRDAEPNWNNMRSSSTVLAFARVDYLMSRMSSEAEDASRLKLNLSFRWMDPANLGHHDVEGALHLVMYKVKQAPDKDYDKVRELTSEGDWPIKYGKDDFGNAKGIFYVPVETAPDIEAGFEILSDHFSEFGDVFGVNPR